MVSNKQVAIGLTARRLFLLDKYIVCEWLFVVLLIVVSVTIAVFGGPDLGFDIKNYHYYIGYAWLHGGFEHNLFPAQMQNWFNLLLDGLTVFLIENLRPILVTAFLACLQSLNIPLLYMLIKQSSTTQLKDLLQHAAGMTRGAVLVIGSMGAMTVSELGTSFGDSLLTALLLGSLVCMGFAFKEKSKKSAKPITFWLMLSGLSFGLAVGLKLTMAIFALGFLPCFYLITLDITKKIKCMTWFFIAALAGLSLTDGFWLWHIWQLTGNPLFPAMNGLFHSNWIAGSVNLLDDRFLPQSLMDGITFPIRSAVGQHPGAEVPYYDLRFVALLCLLPIFIYQMARGRHQPWQLALSLFFYIGFVVWLTLFGIMRYAVPLEFLSGIVLLVITGTFLKPRYLSIVFGFAAIVFCLTTQVPSWGAHLDWNSGKQKSNWFGVDVPYNLHEQNQMFLMLTGEPLSFVIPFFPQDSQFVRMESNLKTPPGTLLYEKRRQAVANHTGPLLTLSPIMMTLDQQSMLASYGLLRANLGCTSLPTNTVTLYACPLERTH